MRASQNCSLKLPRVKLSADRGKLVKTYYSFNQQRNGYYFHFNYTIPSADIKLRLTCRTPKTVTVSYEALAASCPRAGERGQIGQTEAGEW